MPHYIWLVHDSPFSYNEWNISYYAYRDRQDAVDKVIELAKDFYRSQDNPRLRSDIRYRIKELKESNSDQYFMLLQESGINQYYIKLAKVILE